MRIGSSKFLLTVSALILPAVAYAQHISPVIAAFAVSPIVVLLLTAVLGFVSRSWLVGIAHAGLVLLWILLFGIASYWVENDYVIWTPLVLYGVHAVALVALIVRGLLRRARR
ncbi:MAG: hypothetical protein KJP16_01295 [Gammaproteobacteria bacterium]|nr:hypothetical protein [Gammaproteobacteria bacterium]NNL49424.1 hypothetical protein [Woeseiaceae bacterium]